MKKIIVIGPALSQSGYGEQCRFALRSLLSKPNLFDVYLKPLNWGQTSSLSLNDKDRAWIDYLLQKTHLHLQNKGNFDISLQVTIPNEWERLTPINIGYTAGIETDKIAHQWIEKSTLMDKIITISNHSKNIFIDTVYDAVNEATGLQLKISCETPVEVVNYPVRKASPVKIPFNLKDDFNFLTIAQWGPRKNLDNTIKWWVEEFINDEVGLVVKTNLMKNSVIDRVHTEKRLEALLSSYKNRKCNVYLLHGYMSPEEMTSLYQHEKIKSFVSLTHGEGFGLPLFEAAYNGLPIIAPNWSGHRDFLYAEKKMKKNKKTIKKIAPCFLEVKYDLKQVQPGVVWDGVIIAESRWCYPQAESYKKQLRNMHTNHRRHEKIASTLKEHILKNFSEEKMYNQFCDAVFVPTEEEKTWISNVSEVDVV